MRVGRIVDVEDFPAARRPARKLRIDRAIAPPEGATPRSARCDGVAADDAMRDV